MGFENDMESLELAEKVFNKYKNSTVTKMDIPSTYGKHSDLLDSLDSALTYYNAHYRYTNRIGCVVERGPYRRDRIILFDIEGFDMCNEISIGEINRTKISLEGNVVEVNEYEREDDIMLTKHDCTYPIFCGFDFSKIADCQNKHQFYYKEVIFNPPATIIKWQDGTKTVVKCREGDEFDPEKGIALCYMKKALGNKYGYYNTIENLLKKFHDDRSPVEKLWSNLKKGVKNQNGKSDS